jgi:hypothetical protein
LNVVKESTLLADVCILSKAEASCSLSIIELAAMEATELRRFRRLTGEPWEPEAWEIDGFFIAETLSIMAASKSSAVPQNKTAVRWAVAVSGS